MFMGTAIGSAVVPLWNLLMWKNANATGAIVGAWGGMVLGLISWIVVAQIQSKTISVETLGKLEPNLTGNLVAIVSSGLIHVTFSLVKPQNYDFVSMGEIKMLEDDKRGLADEDFDPRFLQEAKAWVQKFDWGFTIVMVIVWPVLSIPAGVFTRDYWSMWVFISVAWAFFASFVIIVLPIYESFDSFTGVIYTIMGWEEVKAAKEPEAAKDPQPVSAITEMETI